MNKMANDPEHESGLNMLPQYTKDLLYISKLDYEFSLKEEDVDHQKYIDLYKELIGIQIEDDKITDDETKDVAIRYITYKEILDCYDHLKTNGLNVELTEEQEQMIDLCQGKEQEIVDSLNEIK